MRETNEPHVSSLHPVDFNNAYILTMHCESLERWAHLGALVQPAH